MMVRKCLKSEENMKRNKHINGCFGGDGNIFEEIKKMRKTKQIVTTSIDGEKKDIVGHFGDIYSKLYNSAEDTNEMQNVKVKVEEAIYDKSIEDVNRITPEIVRKAAHKLNNGENDPTFTFSSDCFNNGSTNLYSKISELLRGFMIHGHVTTGLLISTLVPIVKDPLASINISKNYRSVCLSSLTKNC